MRELWLGNRFRTQSVLPCACAVVAMTLLLSSGACVSSQVLVGGMPSGASYGFLVVGTAMPATFGFRLGDTLLEKEPRTVPGAVIRATGHLVAGFPRGAWDPGCTRWFATEKRFLVLLVADCRAKDLSEFGLAAAVLAENGVLLGEATNLASGPAWSMLEPALRPPR